MESPHKMCPCVCVLILLFITEEIPLQCNSKQIKSIQIIAEKFDPHVHFHQFYACSFIPYIYLCPQNLEMNANTAIWNTDTSLIAHLTSHISRTL